MKYELTFTEAVKALKEDRCEEIEFEDGTKMYLENENLCYSNNRYIIDPIVSFFFGKWRLIGEKPRTEERTVKYWLVVWNDGDISTLEEKPLDSTYKQAQHVFELSHTYTYTFPKE